MKAVSLGVLTCITLCSCAIKNDYAEVSHKPTKTTSTIDHPNKQPIWIEVKDEREEKEEVGYKQNSLGMKTAKILLRDPFAVTLQKAMQDELIAKGFVITEDGLKVLVTLDKCFVDYESNIFAAKSVADLLMHIHVFNQNGDPLYSNKVETRGTVSPIFLYSGKNASRAISKAISKALSGLMQDSYFIATLVGESADQMIAHDPF